MHPSPDMSLDLRLLPTRDPELSQNHNICQPGPRPCSGRQEAWGQGPPPLLRPWFLWALESLSTRGPEVLAPSRAPALSYIPISMMAAAGKSSLFSPAGLSSPKCLFSLEDYALSGQALRTSLGERFKPIPHPRPQSQPPDAQAPALPPGPHSPVEFIVVIVDLPPEVEPGEREAEGEGQEQEPEALPLQGRTEGRGQRGQGWPSGHHCPERSHPSPVAAPPPGWVHKGTYPSPAALAPSWPAFAKQWKAWRRGSSPGSNRNSPTDRCGN